MRCHAEQYAGPRRGNVETSVVSLRGRQGEKGGKVVRDAEQGDGQRSQEEHVHCEPAELASRGDNGRAVRACGSATFLERLDWPGSPAQPPVGCGATAYRLADAADDSNPSRAGAQVRPEADATAD